MGENESDDPDADRSEGSIDPERSRDDTANLEEGSDYGLATLGLKAKTDRDMTAGLDVTKAYR